MPTLANLQPGTLFRQPETGFTGVLISINNCRAVVRIQELEQAAEFQDRNGAIHRFKAKPSEVTSWAPSVNVVPLGHVSVSQVHERTITMAKKKTTRKKTTQKKTTKKSTPAKKSSSSKMSQLDAALKVLAEKGEPLTTKEMVEAMLKKKYWSTSGKTPHATLYSAILRELQNKGKDARFQKVERGKFAMNEKAGA